MVGILTNGRYTDLSGSPEGRTTLILKVDLVVWGVSEASYSPPTHHSYNTQ